MTMATAGVLSAAAGVLPRVGYAGAHGQRPAAQHATPTAGGTDANGDLLVRRNGKDFSAAERQTFVDSVLALKKKPSAWAPGLSVYDTFVVWHRDAYGCGVMAAHMGPAFFPWHRQFLLMFEQELRAIEPEVTLPYWDWSVDNAADSYLWDDDFMGGNGDPDEGFAVMNGPFRKGKWQIAVFDYGDENQFPYLIREFGATQFAPTLPTPEQVETALNVPTYDTEPWNTLIHPSRSFRNAMEGWQDCVKETCDPVNGMSPTCTGPHNLHNQVHLWIAGEFAFAVEGAREGERGDLKIAVEASPATDVFGTMAANTSLSDPVFWLHHTNLDRLWSEWMKRHGSTYEPVSGGPVGHNIDDAMWPYSHLGMTITPRMMLSSRDLGYVYDTDE
jgi:tyrosinase